MNRQQKRRAEREGRTAPSDSYARALCVAGSARLRERIHGVLAAGADPRDTMGLVRDTPHGVEVATCARRALLELLDADQGEDSARIAAGLRRRQSAGGWFPVVLYDRSGTYVTAIRFHLVSRGGDA